jgi:hypothetical protein
MVTPSEHLTKPSKRDLGEKLPELILRFVNKSRWEDKSPGSEIDVANAADDFKLRPSEGYLSFYAIWNPEDGRQIATAFKMIGQNRPARHVDFMIISEAFLADFGIRLQHEPNPLLPVMLSDRHRGTIGPRHEPDEKCIKTLLNPETRTIMRLRKAEMIEIAKNLVAVDPELKRHIGDEWLKLIAG